MDTIRKRKNVARYQEILNYLNKYPELFNENEKKYLLDSVLLCTNSYTYQMDYLREIYDELGIIPDDKNIYIAFSRLINKKFDTNNKNILEVGGGTLPRLSKRLLEISNINNIKVYDPRLSIYEKSTDKLVLKKEKFTKNTNVDDVDLMIGLMPCKGAEELIDSAIINRKDFIIGLCEGGPHGEYYDFYESDEEWIDCMLYTAEEGVKRNNLGTLEVKHLAKRYNYKYPIIYNKR